MSIIHLQELKCNCRFSDVFFTNNHQLVILSFTCSRHSKNSIEINFFFLNKKLLMSHNFSEGTFVQTTTTEKLLSCIRIGRTFISTCAEREKGTNYHKSF